VKKPDPLLENILIPEKRAASPDGFPDLVWPDTRSVSQQRAEKLPALFARFDINPNAPDAWELLACHLAIRYVPGFQARLAQGAPRKNVPSLAFYRYVNAKLAKLSKQGSRAKASSICKRLSRDAEFKKQFPELAGKAAGTLANLYSSVKIEREVLLETRRLPPEKLREGSLIGDVDN
jgi:hypothetical protein